MDMFSLGVLLFVMLTGCKPLPSAVCSKLAYDKLETADYPGLQMPQFKRLSADARDLVLSLMQRRPQHRPSARAAMSHAWLTEHTARWAERGVDLRYLALTPAAMSAALLKGPDVPARWSASRPPARRALERTARAAADAHPGPLPVCSAAVEPSGAGSAAGDAPSEAPASLRSGDFLSDAAAGPELSHAVRNVLGRLQSGEATPPRRTAPAAALDGKGVERVPCVVGKAVYAPAHATSSTPPALTRALPVVRLQDEQEEDVYRAASAPANAVARAAAPRPRASLVPEDESAAPEARVTLRVASSTSSKRTLSSEAPSAIALARGVGVCCGASFAPPCAGIRCACSAQRSAVSTLHPNLAG